MAGCHQPRPQSPQVRSQRGNSCHQSHLSVPSGEAPRASRAGAQGPQRPLSDQDTAAFMPPCTYAEARGTGCYLQATRGRTPEAELAKPLGTTALHALGNGLSPQLGRPRGESPHTPNSGLAASQAGKEDELGAGRPRDTPPAAGCALAPPLPACFLVATSASCASPTPHFP